MNESENKVCVLQAELDCTFLELGKNEKKLSTCEKKEEEQT